MAQVYVSYLTCHNSNGVSVSSLIKDPQLAICVLLLLVSFRFPVPVLPSGYSECQIKGSTITRRWSTSRYDGHKHNKQSGPLAGKTQLINSLRQSSQHQCLTATQTLGQSHGMMTLVAVTLVRSHVSNKTTPELCSMAIRANIKQTGFISKQSLAVVVMQHCTIMGE